MTGLEALINEYDTSIELERIGFPENWKEILNTPNPKLVYNQPKNND